MEDLCINKKYLEYITSIEPILCVDENDEAYICGNEEVLNGVYCHKRLEYNIDCDTCHYKGDE